MTGNIQPTESVYLKGARRQAKTRSARRSFFEVEVLEDRRLLSASIVSGQTVSGVLDLGQTATYTFTANAGDSVIVSGGKTGLPLYDHPEYNAATDIYLYAPNGSVIDHQVGSSVATSGSTTVAHVTSTGTYTVTLQENGGDQVLRYNMTVVVVPGAQHDPNGGGLFDGAKVTGAIEPGGLDVYTFSGRAGNNVNIALNKIDLDPQGSFYRAATDLTLYGPDGTLIENNLGLGYGRTSTSTITRQLTTDGIYTIVVGESYGDDYYTYSLSLGNSNYPNGGAGPLVNGPMTDHHLVAGTDAGAASNVRVYDLGGNIIQGFHPFDAAFTGGTTIASGDVNNDGTPDIIVAAGVGGSTNIRVFNGNNAQPLPGALGSFLAYPGVGGDPAVPTSAFYTLAFQGQINVASGDINGDGHDDIIVSIAANGPPHLKVFSGADGSELMSILVYPGASDPADPAYFGNAFQGGVRIASGDVTGDHRDDIITAAGPGAGPHVKAYDGVTHNEVKSYYAYDQAYSGGVRVAAGDYNGDGRAEIITAAGIGAGPHVKAIDAASSNELASFYAYDPGFLNGIWIASADLNNDGKAEILTIPGAGAASNVKVFQGNGGYAPSAISSFFAFDVDYIGGSRIAAAAG